MTDDASPPHAKPRRWTRRGLVGRDAELSQSLALLDDPAVRLITLTGPGGVGKSCLAERVAAEFADVDGQRAVAVMLAPVGEDDRVIPAIAVALGVVALPGVSLFEAVTEAMGQGDGLLLVLDNAEHLPGVAAIVADLCAAVPRLRVLVTSRRPLHLRLEQVVEVPPLAVPEAEDGDDPAVIRQVAAVVLFTRRVQEILPGFAVTPGNAATVAAICRRLDGLPLAIELVASRARSLSVDDMLARLDAHRPLPVMPRRDAPPRQWSIEASISWSRGLLAEPVRAGLGRLAVFPGSFDLAAAEEVAGVDEASLEILLDHHLVVRDANCDDEFCRFRLLQPVREAELQRLRDEGADPDLRDRHAAFVAAVSERLAGRYHSEEEADALAEAERLRDDVFAALAWTATDGDVRVAARIAVAMTHAWVIGLHWTVGHRWAHRVLAVARRSERVPDALMAQLLILAAITSYHAERLEESEQCGAEAAVLALRHGDESIASRACAYWIQALRALGELDRAAEVEREMLALAARSEDPVVTFEASATSGVLALFRGELDRADRMFRVALATARTMRQTTNVGNILHYLGYVAAFQGDFASGRAALREALNLQQGSSPTTSLAAIWGMARLELLAGRVPEAAGWLAMVLTGRYSRGEEQRTRDAVLDTACLAVLAGSAELAATLLGAVDVEVAPVERNRLMGPLWRAAEARSREMLGEVAFRSAYRQGQVLALSQAVEAALGFMRQVATPPAAPAAPCEVDEREPSVALTAREVEVLRLVMDGRSDREIGELLFISPQTASKHVKHILRKMGAPSRTAAAMVAMRQGLLTPPS